MNKSKEFMEDVARCIVEGGDFNPDLGFCQDRMEDELPYSDGSSYSGFINFTDGFVRLLYTYDPSFGCPMMNFDGGKTKEGKRRAFHAKLAYDSAINWDDWIADFAKANDCRLGSHLYMDPQDAVYAYWEGKAAEWEEDLYQYFNEYYLDAPLYYGLSLILHDNADEKGRNTARLFTFLNNDLGYGREYVAWTKNYSHPLGDYPVFDKTFVWKTKAELIKKIQKYLPEAYESIY